MKEVLFNIKTRLFRRKAWELYDKILCESKLSDDERQGIILDRFKSLLIHAYKNTDFYKEKYDEYDFDINSIRSLEDIRNVPLISKDDLVQYERKFRAKDLADRCFAKSVTGGSTGVPTTVYHDKRVQLEAFNWYLLRLWGARPSDNAAFLARYNPSKTSPIFNRFAWWPTKRVHLDVTNVNDQALQAFYERCKEIRPIYIEGYVGAVEQFAIYLQKKCLRLDGLKFVWTTSAPLLPSTRATIQAAFNCKVYDQYGCCEIYWLGAECGNIHGGLHIFDTFRHVEIIDEQMKYAVSNQYGSIVLTDLLNYAFPLIRYVNGDRGAWAEPCECEAAKFKIILPVRGRVTECILLPSGGFIPGEFLTTIFDAYPSAVRQFQVKQKKDYSLEISYVRNNKAESEKSLAGAMNSIFCQTTKAGLSVNFKEVEEIRNDKGKLRYVISELNK